MTAQTPRAFVLHMAKSISDDGMIIAHVKREFGVTYSKRDIAQIKATLPAKLGRGKIVPLFGDKKDKPLTAGSNDPLLKALAGYHLKHSTLSAVDRKTYQAIAR